MGVPPAAASAGVHTAETFTTAVSAISHVAHRNVDWRLFFRIVIPGVIGGVLGAYVLTSRRRRRQAVRARLSDRRSASTSSIAASCTATPSAGRRIVAAGPGRRLPRCGGRRRLGRDRHLQPARPGQQPAQDDRHRQHRRILPDRDHLGDLHRRRSAGRRSPSHARPADRRRRCAAPFGAWIAKRVNPDTLLTFVGALLTRDQRYGLYRALS
jgi:hypothetical protein